MDGRGSEHVQEYILRQFRLTRQQVIPELLVRFVQRHPTPPPQTPTPAPTPTHQRKHAASTTMYAFHHQSGCEEESGFVPSCEVIAQLPFAQHAQHSVSDIQYKQPSHGSDFALHRTRSCCGSQETSESLTQQTEELTSLRPSNIR